MQFRIWGFVTAASAQLACKCATHTASGLIGRRHVQLANPAGNTKKSSPLHPNFNDAKKATCSESSRLKLSKSEKKALFQCSRLKLPSTGANVSSVSLEPHSPPSKNTTSTFLHVITPLQGRNDTLGSIIKKRFTQMSQSVLTPCTILLFGRSDHYVSAFKRNALWTQHKSRIMHLSLTHLHNQHGQRPYFPREFTTAEP